MKKILPLLADIGHGILATLAIGLVLEVPLSWHFLIGIIFALLPDIDALPRVLRTGSVRPTDEFQVDHRDYLHFPLLYLAVGICTCLVSIFWGGLFLIATSLHFLNDTWGTGSGVMWLWPFSRKKYKWTTIDTWKWNFYSRTIHDEQDGWIDAAYLQVTSISIIEYSTFIVALVSLVFYFFV